MPDGYTVFLVFWLALVTGTVFWHLYDYIKYREKVLKPEPVSYASHDKVVKSSGGIFTIGRKHEPIVRDDAAAIERDNTKRYNDAVIT